MLVMIRSVVSLLDYAVLQYPRFGWPAQLHDKGAIPSMIICATVLSLLNMSHSNYASPATNDTMLVEDHTAKQKTSAVTQLQFQTVEYVSGLAWIVQKWCGFNDISI